MTRRVLALALAGLVAGISGARADAALLTFRVQADGVGPTDRVYIVGSAEALGSWNPAAVPLVLQTDGAWAIAIELPAGTTVEYKVTRGDWASEALGEGMRIQPNARLTITGPQTVDIAVPAWRDQVAPRHAVVGELRFHEQIGGKGIAPRTVSVWLPPGYDAAPDRRYPVLYMHDGQNVFDPSRAAFGMEWRIDEEATRLIKAGVIEPMIVAAIDCNGAARGEEYGDTKLGEAYRTYVVDVVKPLVDANYRTLPDRAHTTVMGSSMGGCVSFLLVWERPDVFSQAACLSPAFFPPVLERASTYTGEPKRIRIYMDNGGVGLEQELQEGCDKMLALLASKGFKRGVDLAWFRAPDAEHNEDAWAARVWRPLEFMFATPDGMNDAPRKD